MHSSKTVMAGLVGAILAGSAMAAPAPAPRSPAVPGMNATALARPDCAKLGSEVSAQIDRNRNSPNIAPARAVFEVGVMECMEGADDSANQHYANVQKMLAENTIN